jgi:hypothetical protein
LVLNPLSKDRGYTFVPGETRPVIDLVGGERWAAGMDRLAALAKALEIRTAADHPDDDGGVRGPGGQGQRPQPEIDQESQAIALLFQYQDWSVARIADYLGVSRQTLYKWDKFREAAELSGRLKPRGPKVGKPRRGHKTRDGRVEAYQDDGEDE